MIERATARKQHYSSLAEAVPESGERGSVACASVTYNCAFEADGMRAYALRAQAAAAQRGSYAPQTHG